MITRVIVYNAKTHETTSEDIILTPQEIETRETAQNIFDEEELMFEFLKEKADKEKEEQKAEFEEWKLRGKKNKNGRV